MAFLRWGLVFGPDDLYAYPADALWVDGGGVARVEVQIGRKGRYRGVISASAGLLRQLNAADPEPPPQLMSSSGTFASFGYPVPGTMWSMAVGGGLLFP